MWNPDTYHSLYTIRTVMNFEYISEFMHVTYIDDNASMLINLIEVRVNFFRLFIRLFVNALLRFKRAIFSAIKLL